MIEFMIVGVIILIATVLLKYVFNYRKKELEHLGEDKELDALAKAYPNNVEMCKEYLAKIGNEKVKIEEKDSMKIKKFPVSEIKIIKEKMNDEQIEKVLETKYNKNLTKFLK